MNLTFLAVVLAAGSFTTHTDTTLSAGPGTRVQLENFAGDIAVKVWARNAVRIEAEHASHMEVGVERAGSTIEVKAETMRGAPSSVDYTLSVPASAALEISGVYGDVTVEGTRGDIKVNCVQGDVHVTGGDGHIALESVEGEVVLAGSRGRAELSSVNADVSVRDHNGDLSAETVNGDISIERTQSGTIEASTVNGDILFDGTLRDDGHYRFTTHDGDAIVGLQAAPNASVSVSTYAGDFESSYPVKLNQARHGKRYRFVLGSGSAELSLESFQGDMKLLRASDPEMATARQRFEKSKHRDEGNRSGGDDGKDQGKHKPKDKGKDSDDDSDPGEEE